LRQTVKVDETGRGGITPQEGRADMKRYFRSIYGATASIQTHRDGTATLTVFFGGKRTRKTYNTERGARIALGRWSDDWAERKEKRNDYD